MMQMLNQSIMRKTLFLKRYNDVVGILRKKNLHLLKAEGRQRYETL